MNYQFTDKDRKEYMEALATIRQAGALQGTSTDYTNDGQDAVLIDRKMLVRLVQSMKTATAASLGDQIMSICANAKDHASVYKEVKELVMEQLTLERILKEDYELHTRSSK